VIDLGKYKEVIEFKMSDASWDTPTGDFYGYIIDSETNQQVQIDQSNGKGIRVKELISYVIQVREIVYSIIQS
jgi:hypothetical protein